MAKTSEIQALITLLGDDDTQVSDIARERLKQIGPPAAGLLRETVHMDVDGKTRIEAQQVLAQIQHEDLIGSFYLVGLLEDEHIDLEQAAFLLARLGYPDLDMAPYQQELQKLTDRVGRRIKDLHPHRDKTRIVRVINQVLFEEEGFSGNVEDYYDPDNSFLNRVLERRTGIPITLSVIYLLIARRLHLPIRGINMPVHFICQYHSPPDSFYFDPFNAGRTLTRYDCMALLHRAKHPFHENFLQPARPRDIIARMMRNLIFVYHHRDDHAKLELLNRICAVLDPS